MFSELRLRGTRTGTSWSTYTVTSLYNNLTWDTKYQDIGAFSVDLPQSYVTAKGIGDFSVFEVAPNGASRYNHWFCIDGTTGTKIVDGNVWRTFSGRSIIAWLEDSIVYPSTWPTQSTTTAGATIIPLQGHAFQNATPGNIIQTLVARSKSRGALAWLDVSSFTGATTTDSVGWSSTLTTTYNNGQTVLEVLQDLAIRNLLQFRMDGMSLKLYNPDSQLTHHSPEQVTFRAGYNIVDENNNTDSSTAASVILLEGDQSIMQESTDDPALDASIGRRREKYVNQTGITDKPTLLMLANAERTINGHSKIEETIGVTDKIEPWNAYDIGDWVWLDTDGTLQNLQIKQIAASVNDSNTLQLGLTLGDIIDDQDTRLENRLNALTGATSGTYGGLPTNNDYLAPAAPTGVSISPTAYRDQNGKDWCQATVSWVVPSTNIDGSTLTDLDHFEVQYKLSTTNLWSTSTITPAISNVAYFSSLPCGYTMNAQIRAVDSFGNASTWATMVTPVTLPKLIATPKTPATPTTASAFQSIIVSWTGLASDGSSYDFSWDHTDIFASTSSGFTPTTSNKVGSFNTLGGVLTISGLAYTSTYYVKLITYDKSGNSSAASGQSGATTAAQLSDPDLPAKLVTGAKIADATINTAQLTVASFGDSVMANGSFQDVATNPTDSAGAAHWQVPYSTGSVAVSQITTAGVPASGTAALQAVQAAAASCTIANSDNIPTTGGDVWYLTFKAKASRAGVTTIASSIALAADTAHVLAVLDINNPWVGVINTGALTTTWAAFEGQIVVPSTGTANPLVIARAVFQTTAATDSAAVTVYLDDVSLRPVGGSASIKDASIVNAKIANVSADKITVGTLSADVTVSSRIKTSDTGARVELNSAGLFAYDVFGNQTLAASDTDGSILMSGTLQSGNVYGSNIVSPSPSSDDAGHVLLNSDGLQLQVTATTNTVPNPGWIDTGTLNPQGFTLPSGNSTTVGVIGPGAAVSDYQGNIDLVPMYGKTALKVYDTTAAQTFNILLGALQPSTTYTVSWHTAASRVDDTLPTTNVYGSWARTQVQRASDGSVVATGRDGYVLLPTSLYPGKYVSAKSSGTDVTAFFGWQVRWYKTFTTPSSWGPNTVAQLVLPTPCVAAGTHDTVNAIIVDAIQCEAHPYMTRYCDGDHSQCSWTGTRGNSSSVRAATLGLWAPLYADPYIQGNQTFDLVNVRTLKLGSGVPHGSNYTYLGCSTQSIPGSAWTNVTWNTPASGTRFASDDGSMLGPSAQYFHCPVSGVYAFSAMVWLTQNATGNRVFRLVNGAGHMTAQSPVVVGSSYGSDIPLSLNWIGQVDAGDTPYFQVYQNSGGALNLKNNSANTPYDASIVSYSYASVSLVV